MTRRFGSDLELSFIAVEAKFASNNIAVCAGCKTRRNIFGTGPCLRAVGLHRTTGALRHRPGIAAKQSGRGVRDRSACSSAAYTP